MVKKLMFFIICLCIFGGTQAFTQTKDNVKVEFRFVYNEPSSDRAEFWLKKTNEKLFADSSVKLSLDDIVFASLQIGNIHIPKKNLSIIDKIVTRFGYVKFEKKLVYEIVLTFSEQSKKKLYKLTLENLGKRLGIFINDELIAAPIIKQPISGGVVKISGDYSREEAQNIIDSINEYVRTNK